MALSSEIAAADGDPLYGRNTNLGMLVVALRWEQPRPEASL